MASNYRLIVKNTLFMYMRLFVAALLGLVISRVLLNTLGIRGFGLFTVVGGLVLMMSFLQNSMAGATQRFLNYEMGAGDISSQKETFATCFYIHKWISFILIILSETAGLWFMNTWMNIHDDEMLVANVIYQLSILTFVVGILYTPYRAAIRAHERMDILAYINITEVILKCIIAYCLYFAPIERLIFYSICLLLINIGIYVIYRKFALIICEECLTNGIKASREKLRAIGAFTGWTLFESIGNLSHVHGVSLAINLFYGLVANAALGIANQVSGMALNFIQSFMSTLNPQIVKNYAIQDMNAMHKLVIHGCKMGVFLVSLISIPIFIEAPFLIHSWLTNVPVYTIEFVRLSIVVVLLGSVSSPLIYAQWATGKIRNFQLVIGFISLMHLPLALLFLKLGASPYAVFYIYIVLTLLKQLYRIKIVCFSVNMKIVHFYYEVVLKSGAMIILSSVAPIYIHRIMHPSFITSILVVLCSLVGIIIFFYFVTLQRNEREFVKSLVMQK